MRLALLLLAAPLASPPAGWWIVDSSNGEDVGSPGAAWQFGAEVVAVDSPRTGVRRTPLACKAVGPQAWNCERRLPTGTHLMKLHLDRDGHLVGTIALLDHDAYGAFNARRATAEETRGLETFVAEARSLDAASCGRAKRCYDLACPLFGDTTQPCDFSKQGMSRDGPSCRAYLPMLVATLKQLGQPVPPECAP